MSTFKEITEQINKEIEASQILAPVSTKGEAKLDEHGNPVMVKVGVQGTLVSKVGTENVQLDASVFQMMVCSANVQGRDKPRYTIVEKNSPAMYGNQFVDSNGNRTHVITRQVYNILLAVFQNTSTTINDLRIAKEHAEEKAELYKLTIDGLRKNGIID